jgi:phosphate ABC transporter permease protein PstC/phosphate ABC transporter permease subunit PstA
MSSLNHREEMAGSGKSTAADFDRPLLLTPGEDIFGYITGKIGRAALFLVSAFSVLMVLLIFVFIIAKSGLFLTTQGGDKAHSEQLLATSKLANETYRQTLEQTGSEAAADQARQAVIEANTPSLGEKLANIPDRIQEMFASTGWFPEHDPSNFGMLALVYGSLMVTVGALIIAVPLGITSAVVLSDIVPFRIRQIVKPIVELLAAIPSVAFGFFAIKIVAPWLQNTLGLDTGANALNASLILAIMAIPTILSVAEDSLTALGRDLREASYALGATRFETLFRVVIPAAHNGIIAAVILGMMRAIGETMVVWMASGNAAQVPGHWWDFTALFDNLTLAVRTMTATIAGDMGETPEGSIHRSALFTVGLLLLVFTFLLNIITEYFVSRFKKGMGQTSAARSGGVGARIKQIAGQIGSALWFLPSLLLRGIGWAIGQLLRLLWLPIHMLIQPVRMQARLGVDRVFTVLAYVSVAAVVSSLLILLGPIFSRGVGAVIFRETVEHRLFLMDKFQRGDARRVEQQFAQAQQARQPIYDMLERLSWLNPDIQIDTAGDLYRQADKQLDEQVDALAIRLDQLSVRLGAAREAGKDSLVKTLQARQDELGQKLSALKKQNKTISRLARKMRRRLEDAYETTDRREAIDDLDWMLNHKNRKRLYGTAAEQLLTMARRYRESIADADLVWREKTTPIDPTLTYQKAYTELRDLITGQAGTGALLGPEDRSEVELLPPEVKYGATRWSMVKRMMGRLNNATVWAKQGQGKALAETTVPREKLFAGTPMEKPVRELITYAQTHLDAMFLPNWTFYWRYWTDVSTPGHFLGGIGPELFGTLLITLLAIAVALPLGVIAAAYLVEVAGDNVVVRILRMCINTLAGVPSIVFGLFGLAFMVGWVTGEPCILAAGLTMSILILPIIIRASEEAIRSVPQTYKEAALGLGAGKLRCFLTVQLPAALPGVLTGTILGMGRAGGETAPLLFTGAVATGGFAVGIMNTTPVLSYSAYDIAVGDRIANQVPHNQYGIVMSLILLVLLLNFAAILLRSRVSKKLRGG